MNLLYILLVIRNLKARKLASIIEKHNPFFSEQLLSLVELRTQDNYFVNHLNTQVALLMDSHKIKIPFPHLLFRLSYIITLIFFLVIQVFPNYAFDIKRSRTLKTSANEITAFPDSVLDIRIIPACKQKICFILYSRGQQRSILSRNSIKIYGLKPGRYALFSKTKGYYINPVKIQILDTPVILAKKLYVMPPGYTGVNAHKLKHNEIVLEGSYIKGIIKVKSDYFKLIYGKLTKKYSGNVHLMLKLKQTAPIRLEAFSGNLMRNMGVISNITIVSDMPPGIELIYPLKKENVIKNDTLHIIAHIYDDIGLSGLYMSAYTKGISKKGIVKKFKGTTDDTVFIALDTGSMGLVQGDILHVILTARDLSGKQSHLDLYYRYPQIEEMTEAIAEGLEKSSQNINEGTINVDSLGKSISKIEQYFKERRGLNNYEKEQLISNLQNTEKTLKMLNKNLSNINRVMNNMSALSGDEKLMRLMKEITKNLNDALTEDMKKLLQELSRKQQVRAMNQQQLESYLKNIEKSRQRLMNDLTMLKKFLAGLKREIRMKKMVQSLSKLLQQQKELNEKTKYFKNIKSLAGEQKKLLTQTESLKDSLSLLADSMENEALKHTIQHILKTDLNKLRTYMKNAMNALNKGNKKGSLNYERQSSMQLGLIVEKMKKALTGMENNREARILNVAKKLRESLLFISFEIEKDIPPDSDRAYAIKYFLKKELDKMMELGGLTLMFSSRYLQLLESSIDYLNTNPRMSMAEVNLIIKKLLTIESMMKGGGGSQGQEDEMARMLKRLLKQQSQITKQSAGMLPLPMPVPSPMQALLRQMLAEQRKAEKLAEMLQKMGKGNISEEAKKALSEMKKAENELRNGQFSENTLKHQRKALSHLLNAMRSIRKKQAINKRKSQPGKWYTPLIPQRPYAIIQMQRSRKLREKIMMQDIKNVKMLQEYINNLMKTH